MNNKKYRIFLLNTYLVNSKDSSVANVYKILPPINVAKCY